MRAALALLGAALMTIAVSTVVLVFEVSRYLATPFAISSTSGLTVFRVENERLVSYAPFEAGAAVMVIGIGAVLLVAAVAIAAVRWRKRMPLVVGLVESSIQRT